MRTETAVVGHCDLVFRRNPRTYLYSSASFTGDRNRLRRNNTSDRPTEPNGDNESGMTGKRARFLKQLEIAKRTRYQIHQSTLSDGETTER